MSERLKRFYRHACVAECEAGWKVELDGRPVRTPARAVQAVPVEALAEAMAEEWNRQGDTVDIARMHLTRLANVAIDRTPTAREALASEVASFCATDLTCHLEPHDSDLRARQEAAWGPLRQWVGQALGITLVPVEGIMPTPQPDVSLEAARRHAAGQDDFALTGLAYGCGLYGSAVLSLAVRHRVLAAGEAFEASILDALHQEAQWGEDAEALAVRAERRQEADALGLWFEALGTPS